jgi:hypothetical protein
VLKAAANAAAAATATAENTPAAPAAANPDGTVPIDAAPAKS